MIVPCSQAPRIASVLIQQLPLGMAFCLRPLNHETHRNCWPIPRGESLPHQNPGWISRLLALREGLTVLYPFPHTREPCGWSPGSSSIVSKHLLTVLSSCMIPGLFCYFSVGKNAFFLIPTLLSQWTHRTQAGSHVHSYPKALSCCLDTRINWRWTYGWKYYYNSFIF